MLYASNIFRFSKLYMLIVTAKIVIPLLNSCHYGTIAAGGCVLYAARFCGLGAILHRNINENVMGLPNARYVNESANSVCLRRYMYFV